MSRSKRRRKDKTWCRSCDQQLIPGDGLGRCRRCMSEEAARRKKLATITHPTSENP